MTPSARLSPIGLETLDIDWPALTAPLVSHLPDARSPVPITIVGATRPEAHYLIDLLSEWPEHFDLLAIDSTRRPVYLSARRYRAVAYRRTCDPVPCSGPVFLLDGPQRDIDPQMGHARFLLRNRRWMALDSVRLVLLTGMAHPEPDAADLLCRELENSARQLACADRKITVLRTPPRYGPLGDGGLNSIAYLMACGLLLAPPGQDSTPIGHVHLADLARVLLGLALQPTEAPYTLCEWGPPPTPLAGLLAAIDGLVARDHLLGEPSGLARLFGLGYQTDWSPPHKLARGLPRLRQRIEQMLDPIRYRRTLDLFGPDELDQLFRPSSAPNTGPLTDRLGFQPLEPLAGLDQTVTSGQTCGWRPYRVPVETRANASRERWRAAQVEHILDTLETYDPADGRSRRRTVELPAGNITIDIHSLHILLETIQKQGVGQLMREGLEDLLARGIPGVLKGLRDATSDWARYAAEQTLEGDLPLLSRGLKALRLIGGELLGNPGRHMRRTLLLQLFNGMDPRLTRLAPLQQLLPDRRIGLLLDSELGTVGMVLAARNGRLDASFPRQKVDRLARFASPEKRLNEFRKEQKLDAAAHSSLNTVLEDIRQEKLISRLLHPGDRYQIAGATTHFRLLSKEMFSTPYARTLFTDEKGRVKLGISTTGASVSVLSEQEMECYERLRIELADGNPETLGELLSVPPQGSIRVLSLTATRKLLAEVLRPTTLGRIMAALERRAARSRRSSGDPEEQS